MTTTNDNKKGDKLEVNTDDGRDKGVSKHGGLVTRLWNGIEEFNDGAGNFMYRANIAPLVVVTTTLTLMQVFRQNGKSVFVAFFVALSLEIALSQGLNRMRVDKEWWGKLVGAIASLLLGGVIFQLYMTYYEDLTGVEQIMFAIAVPGTIAVNTLTRLKEDYRTLYEEIKETVVSLRGRLMKLESQLKESKEGNERLNAENKKVISEKDGVLKQMQALRKTWEEEQSGLLNKQRGLESLFKEKEQELFQSKKELEQRNQEMLGVTKTRDELKQVRLENTNALQENQGLLERLATLEKLSGGSDNDKVKAMLISFVVSGSLGSTDMTHGKRIVNKFFRDIGVEKVNWSELEKGVS